MIKKAFIDTDNILIKKSTIGQFADGMGAFANKNFKKGEVVIRWNLQVLTQKEYDDLTEYEQTNFCHKRNGIIYLYPEPARHVNRSTNPNVIPDFQKEADIALRDIKKGEELTIDISINEDF